MVSLLFCMTWRCNMVKIPKIILILYMLDILFGVVFCTDYFVGRPFWKLTELFHLEHEKNFPTWYSSMQFFIIALFFSIFLYNNFRRDNVRAWLLLLLPLLFLLLSIDEVAELHEWFGYKLDILLPGGSRKETAFGYTGIWMFVVGGPFFICCVLLFRSLKDFFTKSPKALNKFIIGLLFLVGGGCRY